MKMLKIKYFLNKWSEVFASENIFHRSVWIFRRAVYLFLFLNTLTLIPVANELWGAHALSMDLQIQQRFYTPVLIALYDFCFAKFYGLFVAGQLIFLAMGLSGKFQRISAVAIFIFTANLFYKMQLASNGGHNLILNMLFFLMFMDEKKGNLLSLKLKYLNNIVSNFALIAARLQLVILYAAAGIYKLQGELWSRGEALYNTLSVDEFSHPFVKKILLTSDLFLIGGNYFALFYQLAFPVFIWFKKLRFPLLIAGTALHLSIAFMMGLMDFGFAMIACYFVFYSPDTSGLNAVRTLRKEIDAEIPA